MINEESRKAGWIQMVRPLILLAVFLSPSFSQAQTKAVLKGISTNALTENLVVPSGKTLTISSGATITNSGTATGFGGGAISTLTDVTLSGLAGGDFLKYNGSAWINRTAANVRTDLSLGNVENTALSTWAGTTNITTTGTVTSGTWSGSFGAVSGANLTTLNASNLSSGTVATARLGSGTANSSTYLRGDQTWATPAGGGTAIEIDTAAWVEADGNDGTGALGDPAKPYLTMSAAYDAGARTFFLGSGTFAGLSKSGAINIRVRGLGSTDSAATTTITTIESTDYGTITIEDIGFHSCLIVTAGSVPPQAAADTQGSNNGTITLYQVRATNVLAPGGEAGAASDDNAGQGGGGGGSIVLRHCRVAQVQCQGGSAASGGGGAGGNGGTGGHAGVFDAICSIVTGNITAYGGAGGADTGGGTPGNGGNGGALSASYLDCNGDFDGSAGVAGAGGSDGSAGSFDGRFIYILTTTGSPSSGTIYLSWVNGSTY